MPDNKTKLTQQEIDELVSQDERFRAVINNLKDSYQCFGTMMQEILRLREESQKQSEVLKLSLREFKRLEEEMKLPAGERDSLWIEKFFKSVHGGVGCMIRIEQVIGNNNE